MTEQAGPDLAKQAPVLEVVALHLAIRAAGHALSVLRGVNLTIRPGRVHGLVGESGAGKSMVGRTVLNILPRQAVVTDGTIRFQGNDLLHLTDRQRRRMLGKDISLIPQDPMTALNPVHRIVDQITDVMRLHLGLSRQAARRRAHGLLEEVHIRDPDRVLDSFPHELSGGMRQRVLIAAAFACEPKLIIADEPTTALDVTVQRQILRLIRELQANHGTAILFVTHDLGVVAKICEEVSVIHAGRILEHGPIDAIVHRPSHPYTQALFAATPRYDRPGDTLRPVPADLIRRLEAEALDYDGGRVATRG